MYIYQFLSGIDRQRFLQQVHFSCSCFRACMQTTGTRFSKPHTDQNYELPFCVTIRRWPLAMSWKSDMLTHTCSSLCRPLMCSIARSSMSAVLVCCRTTWTRTSVTSHQLDFLLQLYVPYGTTLFVQRSWMH